MLNEMLFILGVITMQAFSPFKECIYFLIPFLFMVCFTSPGLCARLFPHGVSKCLRMLI